MGMKTSMKAGIMGVLATVLLVVIILNVLAGTVGIVIASISGVFGNMTTPTMYLSNGSPGTTYSGIPLAELLAPSGVMGIVYGASVLILVILLVLGFMKLRNSR